MYDQSLLKKPDPVITDITVRIEIYLARIKAEYAKKPATFAHDLTRQDAAMKNIVRAVTALLAIGEHLPRKHQLGMSQTHIDVFHRLAMPALIPADLADNLKKMIGFRNVILYEYLDLQAADLKCFILEELRCISLFINEI